MKLDDTIHRRLNLLVNHKIKKVLKSLNTHHKIPQVLQYKKSGLNMMEYNIVKCWYECYEHLKGVI